MCFSYCISVCILYITCPKYLHDIFDKKCVAKTVLVLVTKKLLASGCDTESIAELTKM